MISKHKPNLGLKISFLLTLIPFRVMWIEGFVLYVLTGDPFNPQSKHTHYKIVVHFSYFVQKDQAFKAKPMQHTEKVSLVLLP